MIFRLTLINLQTSQEKQYRTMKELSNDINLPYHQCLSILKADDKIFLHPKIKELRKIYFIKKNI